MQDDSEIESQDSQYRRPPDFCKLYDSGVREKKKIHDKEERETYDIKNYREMIVLKLRVEIKIASNALMMPIQIPTNISLI